MPAAETYVLDAFAILALLGGEAGAVDVAAILSDPACEVVASAINVGEVVYILRRTRGAEAAERAEEALYSHPGLRVVEATRARIRDAARVKTAGGLSLADSFACALAMETGGVLVTGDPEFRAFESRGALRVRWLRREPRG